MERRLVRHFDWLLLALAVALVAYGAILIYSASLNAYSGLSLSHPMTKQIVFALLGLAVAVLLARIDYRVWGQAAPLLYVLALLLLVAVLAIGESAYGSRRWFSIAGIQVQASEVAKLLIIAALARFLADRQAQIRTLRVFLLSMVMAAAPAALVMAEPDMGTAIIIGTVWAGMALVAGVPFRHLLVSLGILLSAIPFAALIVMGDYQRERIGLWINPNSDPLGGGYNILQGEISIGSGGLFGKGLFDGSQTQLDFLHTPTTDYIFAVLGEELGLLGALILFALFTALLFRAIRGAAMARDQFGRVLVSGVVLWILFQVFINVAVNVRLVPVTGVPLPFISQGGSSLVMLFAALGIIESIVLRHKAIEF